MLQVLGLALLLVAIVCVVYEVGRVWWSPMYPELWKGLVGWWVFQEQGAIDISGNGNHGEVTYYAVWNDKATPEEISTLHDNPWALCKR